LRGHLHLSRGLPGSILVDGEVAAPEALRLFRERGEAMLPALRGSFALAAWDEASRSLLLARDAFGGRPLFYCVRGPEIWFGTEVPKGAPLGQIDRGALSDFLELGYVPAPVSVWSGVSKLAAGHLVRFGEKGAEVRRWSDLPAPGGSPRKPSRIAVRARLEQAVKRRLDGHPAALLSGGLESSALVALMTRLSGKVRTYTTGTAQDLEAARRIATRFRTEHHEVPQGDRPFEELPRLIAGATEPFADPALPPLAALLRQIRGPVITGDGADELFAGHPRHLHAARIPRLSRTARAADFLRKVAPARHRGTLQRAAGALGSTGAERARAFVEVFSLDERRLLLGGEARIARGATSADLRGADASLAFDLEVSLPEDVLFRLNLARGTVETRTPYADVDLAHLVVPPLARHKFGRIHGRRLLREAVADLLPRDVLMQPARTLEPPLGAWLRGPLRQMLGDLVRTPTARIRVLLDPRGIDQALAHALRPRGNPRKAWALLCLELWARESRG
jgi:asparagine synthase (glutamine-hydrolysing)